MTPDSMPEPSRRLSLDRTAPGGGGPGAERELADAQVLLAFAPLHKRAFGAAVAVACALLMAAVTLAVLLIPPVSDFPLELMQEFFVGYTVSWTGLLVGVGWGAFVGFVAGWFVAFCRNLAVALSVFALRTRAELAQTRDFLDHI